MNESAARRYGHEQGKARGGVVARGGDLRLGKVERSACLRAHAGY